MSSTGDYEAEALDQVMAFYDDLEQVIGDMVDARFGEDERVWPREMVTLKRVITGRYGLFDGFRCGMASCDAAGAMLWPKAERRVTA